MHIVISVSFFTSQELIEQVKAYGGRFLGKCNDGSWYVMNTEDARKRAIQGERLNKND
jgi:hypothetical protein